MAKPVNIGLHSFKTKSAAKEYIRATRDRYPIDGIKIDSSDEHFLHDLFARHPEANDKLGAGISHFTVETDPVFRKTRHFMVHRKDGTSTDFSFNACIDDSNERADRLESLRRAVKDQIVAFRDETFSSGLPLLCPLDGSLLSPTTSHIDHASPKTFLILVQTWLRSEAMDIHEIQITPPQDNQVVANMTASDQIDSWTSFHRANATLRAVSPRSNLSAGSS